MGESAVVQALCLSLDCLRMIIAVRIFSKGHTPLTCNCHPAQERGNEVKVLQEKISRLMDAEGQMRHDLEAEQSRTKVLTFTCHHVHDLWKYCDAAQQHAYARIAVFCARQHYLPSRFLHACMRKCTPLPLRMILLSI